VGQGDVSVFAWVIEPAAAVVDLPYPFQSRPFGVSVVSPLALHLSL
jgi:hypothetical protein